MALRPAMAKWFEVLIAREELTSALQCLAGTGTVELQAHGDGATTALLPSLRAAVDEYGRLARRYGEYWPQAAYSRAQRARAPEEIPSTALAQLRAWAADADPLIDRLQKMALERTALQLLEQLLSRSGRVLPDLQIFAQAGPVLASRAYLFPFALTALAVPPSVLTQTIAGGARQLSARPRPGGADGRSGRHPGRAQGDAVCAACGPARRPHRGATAHTRAHRGDRVRIAGTRVATRRTAPSSRRGHRARRSALHRMAGAERSAARTHRAFCMDHGMDQRSVGGRLQAALDRGHLHFCCDFRTRRAGCPAGRTAQPGVGAAVRAVRATARRPGASEADPSRVLAFVAPLMFGFMFAESARAWSWSRRAWHCAAGIPATAIADSGRHRRRLFRLCCSAACSPARGSLPALWLRPLDQPLRILEVSLAFGALRGLARSGAGCRAAASGAVAPRWWAARAGLVCVMRASSARAFDSRALWALPAGLGWYLAGSAMARPADRWPARRRSRRVHRDAAAARDQYDLVRARRCLRARARGARGVAGWRRSGPATGARPPPG